MEFENAMALIEILHGYIKQSELEVKREGRGARSVNPDVRVVGTFTEGSAPVALKGRDGVIWLTTYDSDGRLPQVVEEDLCCLAKRSWNCRLPKRGSGARGE